MPPGRKHPGRLQVVHHHLASRSEGRLHPGLAGKAALHGALGQQSGAEQHSRVAGVGAAGDGGDDHRAVAQVIADAAVSHWRAGRRALGGRAGRRLLLPVAGPSSSWAGAAASISPSEVSVGAFIDRKGTRSWGRFGPARDGSTVARSRARASENSGSASPRCEEALRPAVRPPPAPGAPASVR